MKAITIIACMSLATFSCRHAASKQDAELADRSQDRAPLICDVDVSDGLSSKDRRDQFWFYDLKSKETKIKWVSFVGYNGPSDPGQPSVLHVLDKKVFRCPGCFEFLAESSSPQAVFKIGMSDSDNLNVTFKESNGEFSKFSLKDGRCKQSNGTADNGIKNKPGVCVRYAANNSTVSMKLDSCVDHSMTEKRKFLENQSLCKASNELQIFGNSSRALRKKFVFIADAENCADPSIPVIQSTP